MTITDMQIEDLAESLRKAVLMALNIEGANS